MAVKGFTSQFAGSLGRLRLKSEATAASLRTAGEADSLPKSRLPNDRPIPAEHTSPEDVAPDEIEDGKESYQHEIKRIDPHHFDDVKSRRDAALHDELARAPAEVATPIGADPTAPAAGGAEADPAAAVPNPNDPSLTPQAAPPGSPAAGGQAPEAQGDPSTSPTPDIPQPGGVAPAEGQVDNSTPVFDFEHGLDPASMGQLVNDWQTNVDSKLFSRHTNIVKISQKGNAVTFMVQAFNTDTGAKPDVSTGYAQDGAQRGELMVHLREVFQPTGPAIAQICGTYNDFLEDQADKGAMPLLRVKPAGSNFQFQPQDRKIEGWSDSGLGRDPIWRATPYTVYTVALTIQFVAIGGQQQGG